jgi:hypothetical protein
VNSPGLPHAHQAVDQLGRLGLRGPSTGHESAIRWSRRSRTSYRLASVGEPSSASRSSREERTPVRIGSTRTRYRPMRLGNLSVGLSNSLSTIFLAPPESVNVRPGVGSHRADDRRVRDGGYRAGNHQTQRDGRGGSNGIRTRLLALRGPIPTTCLSGRVDSQPGFSVGTSSPPSSVARPGVEDRGCDAGSRRIPLGPSLTPRIRKSAP